MASMVNLTPSSFSFCAAATVLIYTGLSRLSRFSQMR